MNLDGCRALITGASAGIGYEFARQLASRVAFLLLVARREDRLNGLRDELRRRNPTLQIEIRPTDLSDQAQVDALCEWIAHENIAIDLLVNNAGLGDSGPFATSDATRLKEMMQCKHECADVIDALCASANDRAQTRRDSQCQFVGRFPSDS